MLDRSAKLTPGNPKANADVISREYLDLFGFEQRLIGSAEPDISAELFGCRLASPVMTAALSRLDRIRQDGLIQMAEAVRKTDTVMWLGVSEDEEVRKAADTGVRLIEIIKPFSDMKKVTDKIRFAVKNGCIAVGMDIDHAFDGHGKFDVFHDIEQEKAPTVSDIREYVQACDGIPFIVKGVLSVRDAAAAKEAGASAIVLSTHHGIFQNAISPLMILPEVRKAVGKDMQIITDGLIYDGYDAFKALVLGADGVCVGRALQQPLSENGEEGIRAYFNEMNEQLAVIMARTGTSDLNHIDSSVMHRIR